MKRDACSVGGVTAKIRHVAPPGPDTTEGTLVMRRPPHGGSLQWETAHGLGEPGERNRGRSPRERGKPWTQAAVRLEPARWCLASDTGC